MQTSIYCATKTLLENGVKSLPLLSDDIIKMIENCGFTVVPFNKPLSHNDIEDFKNLGLLSHANSFSAFTYSGTEKYVFYRSDISAERKLKLLAHELGHITLNHLSNNCARCSSEFKDTSEQEREADSYAFAFLAPVCVLQKIPRLTPQKICQITLLDKLSAENVYFKAKEQHRMAQYEVELCENFNSFINKFSHAREKRLTIFILIITITFSISILKLKNDLNITFLPSAIPVSETTNTSVQYQDTEMVSVTKSGKKYHKKDCRHIQGRYTYTLSESDAINQGYEACDTCKP